MDSPKIGIKGCLVPIGALLLLLLFQFISRELKMSEGRRMLPSSASEIQEFGFHGIVGDHRRLTKAKITEEKYSDYAKSLNLTTKYDPTLHGEIAGTLNIQVSGAPSWWNPPAVDQTTYFEYVKGTTYVRVLRYHDGHVYYLSLSW